MHKIWPNKAQTDLLKACLLSGLPAEQAWKRWREQIDFDAIDPASHNLVPLMSRNPSLLALQDPVFEKCKGIYRYTWLSNQLLWKEALSVLSGLTKAGVDQIVLLKGMAMVLHYYRDFGMRAMADVDFLIKKSQATIAGDFLKASGWKQNVARFDLHNPAHLDSWHALNFMRGPKMDLDLHWSLIQENCLRLDAAALKDAQPVTIETLNLYILHPTHLLLQICVHGMKYSPVPLIRWIADAVTIVKMSGPQIDWDRLVDLARHARVCNALSSALQYLSEQFASPIPQTAIQQLRSAPSMRLERLEYWCHARGYWEIAGWHRYCLNRGYFTRASRMLHLHKYLQTMARLPSPWLIPFFSIYWILKRLYRFFMKFLGRPGLKTYWRCMRRRGAIPHGAR